MLLVILALTVILPIAWFCSEFRAERSVRIGLGCAAIAMSFGVAWIVGSLGFIRTNVYFSEATKDLIQNTIIELEKGNSEQVLRGLTELRGEFRPTYETHDDYDVLVDRYIERISDDPVHHEDGNPLWSHEMPGETSIVEEATESPVDSGE
ncbi:MAG: hypothetical protein AAFX06_05555 [Planctomycetota bacterium]